MTILGRGGFTCPIGRLRRAGPSAQGPLQIRRWGAAAQPNHASSGVVWDGRRLLA